MFFQAQETAKLLEQRILIEWNFTRELTLRKELYDFSERPKCLILTMSSLKDTTKIPQKSFMLFHFLIKFFLEMFDIVSRNQILSQIHILLKALWTLLSLLIAVFKAF